MEAKTLFWVGVVYGVFAVLGAVAQGAKFWLEDRHGRAMLVWAAMVGHLWLTTEFWGAATR